MGGSGGVLPFVLKKEKSSLLNGMRRNPGFLIHNLSRGPDTRKAVHLPEHCGLR